MSSISAGTTSGTALVSTGDTTGTLDLKTGASATTALSIDASQNVGIGTSSPSYKLDVVRSGNGTVSEFSNGTSVISIYTGATSSFVGGASLTNCIGFDSSLNASVIKTNNTERLYINSSGNVGIGTSSPSAARLHVVGVSGGYVQKLNNVNSTRTWAFGVDKVSTNDGIFVIDDVTAGANRLCLDTSGNLGLGVTPSAWSLGGPALQLVGGASFVGNSARSYINANCYWNGSNWVRNAAGYAIQQINDHTAGSFQWNLAGNSTAGTTVGFTGAMTLDASGNLGIGGSPSTATRTTVQNCGSPVGYWVSSGVMQIQANSIYNNGDKFIGSGYALYYAQEPSSGVHSWSTSSVSGSAGNAVTHVERARIDSSGNLLVGTTSAWSASVHLQVKAASGAAVASFEQVSSSGDNIYIRNTNGIVGSITTSGSSTAYNTSSDYRLKENIQPMTGALATVAQLNPVTYNWKADGSAGQGFIAHELQAVVPDCVTGEKDAVDAEGNPQYQGVDTSFLVATLTKAIQEQQSIIESLTARIAALENK